MGLLTRDQMVVEVQTIIENPDTNATAIETRLNWAYEAVADSKYWRVLQIEDKTTTLVTSQEDYSLPSTLKTAEYVWIVNETDNVKTILDVEDLAQYISQNRHINITEGHPRSWSMVGSKIRLYVIPSSAVNGYKLYIIGKRTVPYFTTGSDTTVLDQLLDRAIIYKCAEIAFGDLLFEGSEANRYRLLYQKSVDDAYGAEVSYSQI